MHRKNLLTQLQHYKTSQHIFSEEKPMLDQFLQFVTTNQDCFERSNIGHVTGSVWIVNNDYSKVLLTHHKKLNMWLQLGGHADGEIDIPAVALKEAQEESGIHQFKFLQSSIFDIDVHSLPNACAYHYDVRFLLQADSEDFIISDESHDLAWVSAQKLCDYTQERSVLRMQEKFLNHQGLIMKKIIVLVFTSLFVTTSFSMLQERKAYLDKSASVVKLQNLSPHSENMHTLTTRTISDVKFSRQTKQERNSQVDRILKDYRKGIAYTLAGSAITAGTVYAGTRTLPVLSDYSISSAAWAGAHVGILTHMVHTTNAFSRLSELIPLPDSKINTINELSLGVLLNLAAANIGSILFAASISNTTSDINSAFGVPALYATFLGLVCASAMHEKINELATTIKSLPDSDLGPNDDNYLCSIG